MGNVLNLKGKFVEQHCIAANIVCTKQKHQSFSKTRSKFEAEKILIIPRK